MQANSPERNGGAAPARTPDVATEAAPAEAPKPSAAAGPAAGDTAKKPGKPIKRRAAPGRLDPQYAADLLQMSGNTRNDDDARAFLDRPKSDDALAEGLGEGFLQGATSGEDDDQEALDPDDPEGDGGPFVETTAEDEFAYEPDASNPVDAEREPFPTTQSNS